MRVSSSGCNLYFYFKGFVGGTFSGLFPTHFWILRVLCVLGNFLV